MSGSTKRMVFLSGTAFFGGATVFFGWMYWQFYLKCATWFGFNSEGRCFDDVEQVVYHSQSNILGGFALIALVLAAGFFLGYAKAKS